MAQCNEKYRVWRCIKEDTHLGLHMSYTVRDNNLFWNDVKIQEKTPQGELVAEVHFLEES